MLEFGVSLPTIGMDDPLAVRLVAEQAEAAGLDSVWAADHIVLPTGTTSPYPYSDDGEFLISPGLPFMDQFTTLAYVAGFTTRLKLGTAVNLLPLRHPLTVAKIVATLDVLSGGRTILGVAAGWLEEEFTALGISFNDRGALLNEGLEVLQQAWTQPETNYHGQHYQVEGVASYPQPVQKPYPPIWLGGHTKPVMRRAAKYGSMWMPPLFKTTPEQMAQAHGQVRAMAEEAGRGPDAVGLALRVLVDLREKPDASGAEKRSALVGSPREVVEALKGYVRIGVSHFIFLPQARTLADVQQTVDQLAQKVIPQLKEATP
jgi:probable F420-dependent oxidoreductase